MRRLRLIDAEVVLYNTCTIQSSIGSEGTLPVLHQKTPKITLFKK